MRAPTSNGLWLRLDLPMDKFRHIEKQFRHTKNMRNSIRNQRSASQLARKLPSKHLYKASGIAV